MTAGEVLTILDDIRARLAAGDSWEGSFSYLLSEDGWDVRAAYRIGNRDGQGGMRLIGPPDGEPQPEPEKHPVVSCVVCEDLLFPSDEPPHCEGCSLEDKHMNAWLEYTR